MLALTSLANLRRPPPKWCCESQEEAHSIALADGFASSDPR
jgi:hypothetical protein